MHSAGKQGLTDGCGGDADPRQPACSTLHRASNLGRGAVLQNGNEWFESLNKTYRVRKEAACRILDELGCSYSANQSGLFVWAKAPAGVLDVEKWIDEILYGAKVFITPGFIFGEAGRRFIRISLCAPVEKLEQAVERIQVFKSKEGIGKSPISNLTSRVPL